MEIKNLIMNTINQNVYCINQIKVRDDVKLLLN